MTQRPKIIECVANVSYGHWDKNLEKIIHAIKAVSRQKLLDVDNSPSANRTVLTFAGLPEAVSEAAVQLFEKTMNIIDMRHQKGTHPRIGAIDVCPFVPLVNTTIEEVNTLVHTLGKRVGDNLNIPIYLYEHTAQQRHRQSLPEIRKGNYEKLPLKMQQPQWQPDFGPKWNSHSKAGILKTGATVMGCRDILVAFNISLKTNSTAIAQKIAYRIRTIGWPKSIPKKPSETRLKLPKLRAIGWYSEDYNSAQVSCNVLDYRQTSPFKVWETVKKLAVEYGTEAIGCEVIGLIPEACILEAASASTDKKNRIKEGIEVFGFNKVRPFDSEKKILDYRIEEVMKFL